MLCVSLHYTLLLWTFGRQSLTMFEEHHWLDYKALFWLRKTVCCMFIIFNLSMRLYGCLSYRKMGSERRAPGMPPQTPRTNTDISRHYFWACLWDWMAPSSEHGLQSDTRTHEHKVQSHPRFLAHTFFLPDICIMKCTVIYVSSEIAGYENECSLAA